MNIFERDQAEGSGESESIDVTLGMGVRSNLEVLSAKAVLLAFI